MNPNRAPQPPGSGNFPIEMRAESVDATESIPTQADDAALLRAFHERGDRQAMNVVFARHTDAAYRVALRCCRNAADAEDAVQNAFIEVLRHAAQYRGESAVRAWIFGFVVNACRHKAREEGRRAAREERASVSGDVMPDDRALRDALHHAVHGLPDHYRVPVWLHYCEGLSSPEVADALSLSENTVRSQLSRGVEELRSALASSGLALSSVALVGALATAATESAPATLTASISGLASAGAPAAAKAGILAKAAAGTMAAAAILSTAAALWWGGVPEEIRPPDFAKIDERIKEWQPTPEERRFDEIGWAEDLPEALRLGRQHQRPIFVVAHVGRLNTGRSDGGSMALREGPLSTSEVIEMLNSRFVPVYVNTEDPANKDHARIYKEALKAKLGAGSEQLYFLEPEGAVVDSLAICHVTTASLLESLRKHAREPGPTLVPPALQSLPPAETKVLHLTARYLDPQGRPLKPNKSASYHAFPAEDWVGLSPADEAALVPDAAAPLGAAWDVDLGVAGRLLCRLYPLTGNHGPPEQNHIGEAGLHANVVAGRRSIAWIRLEGRVRLGHSFFANKDERSVEGSVLGYLEFDRKTKTILTLRLVTEHAVYGKENFGVAVRSVP
jgi:RNA polymerase sigma-70 factor (ECF subfamily)